MIRRDEFQQQATSIEALVTMLENAADPAVRNAGRDLVQALMQLHGAALERLLEIVRATGDPGRAIIEQFSRDELVRSVLLLYGLHPQDLRTRVVQALESTCAFLKSHGADAELVSIDDAGGVTVHFRAKSGGCGATASSLRSTLEAAIQDTAPDASCIVIKDTSPPSSSSAFVALADLQTGRAAKALSRPHAQRSGN
jgi:Fe-S cluster biogenesis protein NfuA